MCVEGVVNGASIFVLIDSGASHNFVSPQVVAPLNLEMDPLMNWEYASEMVIKFLHMGSV